MKLVLHIPLFQVVEGRMGQEERGETDGDTSAVRHFVLAGNKLSGDSREETDIRRAVHCRAYARGTQLKLGAVQRCRDRGRREKMQPRSRQARLPGSQCDRNCSELPLRILSLWVTDSIRRN